MTEQLNGIKPTPTLGLYPTPEWATAELLQRLPLEPGDVILDPASGDSAIARVIKEFSSRISVVTNDIDSHRQADFHFDMTLRESWKWIERSTGGFDWAIGNPPLHSAPLPGQKTGRPIVHFFLQMGYQHARKGIVFLLRKSFSEPVGYRRVWLQTSTREQFLELRLEPIRFKGERRSAQDARDWYGWRHGHTGGFVPEYIWRTP